MSGEAVAYHLRQNKHVERQLFAEVLSHLDRLRPIKDYLYASFGGVYFEDFKLVHNVFGSEKMLSIEEIEWVRQRQEHNVPYGCIHCERLKSGELIDGLDHWREHFGVQNLICWLDYASAKHRRQQLEEFRSAIGRLEVHDVLKITINANPGSLGDFSEEIRDEMKKPGNTANSVSLRNQFRLKKLNEELGDLLPGGIDDTFVVKDQFPALLLQVIRQVASRAMNERPGEVFQPLASFSYADSEHTMLTCTGIVLKDGEIEDFKEKSVLHDFAFHGLDWNLHQINVPLLSAREKSRLDHEYARKTPEVVAAELGFQLNESAPRSLAMLKDYFKFHRFYPHYHRIQY